MMSFSVNDGPMADEKAIGLLHGDGGSFNCEAPQIYPLNLKTDGSTDFKVNARVHASGGGCGGNEAEGFEVLVSRPTVIKKMIDGRSLGF